MSAVSASPNQPPREQALELLQKERCLAKERSPFPADFHAGWEAGVEWAEEHGELSMVKFFVDTTREAEESKR